ncbi:MAG: hypothetical protein GY711_22680 [bacterium]|nr:hypothetical protein [bacterium]
MQRLSLLAPILLATAVTAPAARSQTSGDVELLLAQPFELDRDHTHLWRAERPVYRAGYLVVLEVPATLARVTQTEQAVLFAGAQTVARLNHGQLEGDAGTGRVRLVGIVPESGADVDLERTPFFFGAPELPERIDATDAARELADALTRGVAAPASDVVRRALDAGGAALVVPSFEDLELRAADLIDTHSPREADLTSQLRAPRVPLRGTLQSAPPRRTTSAAASGSTFFERTQLAGNALATYPHVEYVAAFNEGSQVELAFDPLQIAQLAGVTADVYVAAHKDEDGYINDPVLVDEIGGPLTLTFSTSSIETNRFSLATQGLSGSAGTELGVGFDIVIDVDRDGQLDADDWVDGGTSEAGFYVVHDVTQPGPLAVTETIYSGGSFLQQDLYYPTDVAPLGQLPLVVVSHGNGHNYRWYDHLGFHLASYGYVVMSHSNNTVPGIETSATTTLTNTDYFLGNLSGIAGGALDGHIDTTRITWIGHSRGGEGVVRAYQRLWDGSFTPSNYTVDDIVLISSIAPTTFLPAAATNPHDENYHLWAGGADADLIMCSTSSASAHVLPLHERATGFRQMISLQGTGHGDFHDGGGSSVASGPCLIGRANTHTIMRGQVLPLLHHYVHGNVPARDFLWRQWESFRPIGAPTTACAVVSVNYRRPNDAGVFVLDDYQSNPSVQESSSGGAVATDLAGIFEARLRDTSNFGSTLDGVNGMMQAVSSQDDARGTVFGFDGVNRSLALTVPAIHRDVRGFDYLSFRACQITRHPLTTAASGDVDFSVRLRDESGVTSEIAIGAYGGGVEEPYQRTGCGGGGPGWANEWEVIRLRVADFQHSTASTLPGGTGLDLEHIAEVEFLFGPSWGSPSGRLGLDEIRFEQDALPDVPPIPFGVRFCSPAVPNSTGLSGAILVSGSRTATDNDIVLTAFDLPPDVFGYFLVSQTEGNVPFPPGAAGILCLSGTIGRFSQQVENSGPTGTFSTTIDLTAIPLTPPVAVVAGESWNFQGWHRDVLITGPTSNFTDGFRVLFE